MTLPRSQLVCTSVTSRYHCICRCVRQAFLCGEDAVTDKDYSHRKGWVLERLALLAEVFTIDLCGYAVMSNHYHLVISINQDKALQLSDNEVANRWSRLFVLPEVIVRWQQGLVDSSESKLVETLIAIWRRRLADLSWYMRCLNEHIARLANMEDGCKGRFWEGRFKSQAILDDVGLMACMVYVDLNPLRAALVSVPEDSADVSIHQRLAELRSPNKKACCDKPLLLPFSQGRAQPECLPYTLSDYLALLDWSGRAQRVDKPGSIPPNVPMILVRLGIDSGSYLAALACQRLSRGTAIGQLTNSIRLAVATGRHRVVGSLLRARTVP